MAAAAPLIVSPLTVTVLAVPAALLAKAPVALALFNVTASPLPDDLLLTALHRAWDRVEIAERDTGVDRMYRLAEGLPGEALAARVQSAQRFERVYVDRTTGRLLAVMDESRRAYAWTYYALHTLNFPGLNARPALRTAAIVSLMLLGLAFSVTGVIIGVRRLRFQFT